MVDMLAKTTPGEKGPITLTVTSPGLADACCSVAAK